MEVRSIEITKRVAVIATALSLLLQAGSPSGVGAKSHRMRSKVIHHHRVSKAKQHRQIAQNLSPLDPKLPPDGVGPAGMDFQDHDPEMPAEPPVTGPGVVPGAAPGAVPGTAPGATPGATPGAAPGATPGATPGAAPGATPGATPGAAPGATPGATPGAAPGATPGATPGAAPGAAPPRTPFAFNQDVGLINLMKTVTASMESPTTTVKLSENQQIVVGLARQILTQAIRKLESSGQGVASSSENTKLWNSPKVKLSDRFHGSVAANWKKTNDGMLSVTITGDCSDNTVVDGKKIGEFSVSVEARSTVDVVDENKWSANISKVSVDADCCRGEVAVAQGKKDEQPKKLSPAQRREAEEKRKQEEEKKAKLPDSFFEYDKPGKERNVPPLVVAAPTEPTTPKIDLKRDSTTVEAPPVVAHQVTKTEAPPAVVSAPVVSELAKDAGFVGAASTAEAPKDAGSVPATAVEEPKDAGLPSTNHSNSDNKILTSYRRNQYLDVRAFQEQQKSAPEQELPWTEHPDIQRGAEGEEDDDKYGVKKAEKKAAEEKALAKKAEKAERKRQKKLEKEEGLRSEKTIEKQEKKVEKAEEKRQKKEESEAEDKEGQYVDKAIEKQEKEAAKETAREEKEAAKAQKEADKAQKEADKARQEADKKAQKAEQAQRKVRPADEPKKSSIEDLFNQDLGVGDEFMDTKKVERMERMSRTIAAKQGVKEAKGPKRDKSDDLLAQALAEEQGIPFDSSEEGKNTDKDNGIPDTFGGKNTKNAAPRKLFDRLDPDEEITPSAPVEKKPEMTYQERLKRANRPEGVDEVIGGAANAASGAESGGHESTTPGVFTGPISLRDPIADQFASPGLANGGDPISQSDQAVSPGAQPGSNSAIEGWNRIGIPDEAASTANAVEHVPDRLIASSTAKVRGKGGSIASKLFAQESAFSPNNLISSRPAINSMPSAINSLGTIFDGNAKAAGIKRPGLEAIIVMPDRAIAGENLTIAVREKKNQPEHEIELNFNGAPLATDGKGQAQYHVPDDATPGKTLLVSVTGRPELRCIEVIQPLSAPSSSRPSIDNISKLVVAGSVVTINGHNFSGVAADNKVTIDNRDAEIVAASPLQLKVALPPDLLPGTHSIGIKNDRDNHDSFDYVTTEIKLEPKRSQLIIKINGTAHPVHVRLTNRTPELIQIDQGDNVLVTTSGGQFNTCSVSVRQVKKDFKVDADIEI